MDCSNVTIVVAAHKAYRMPTDPMYLPLQVGAAQNPDILFPTRDNTGDNISSRNPSFCELTGLYWAWKNLDSDYIGLVHYRRYFGRKGLHVSSDPFDRILTYRDLQPMLGKYRIFVPYKRYYVIESLYSHYVHTHYAAQLDMTRSIIAEDYPAYLDAFDRVLKQTSGYMFNMCIMRKDWMDRYCTWLFDILMKLEDRLDMPDLSSFQARYFGRISEIIFNVWLTEQISEGALDKKQIRELPYVQIERVNWVKKGNAFLRAKFLHEKYNGSF